MTIDVTFSATIEKVQSKGGWHYVIWPEAKEILGTGGTVKVRGTIDGHPFEGAVMPMGGGRQMIPVKAELRTVIQKQEGDSITIHISEAIR